MNIFEAVRAGNQKEILLNASQANNVDVNGFTPIMMAVQHRMIEAIEVLIDNRAQVNATNKEGNTPLHLAVLEGRVDISNLLLNSGADIEAKDKLGYTALITAATKNRLPTARLLLERGASVNARSTDGVTSLVFAASIGNDAMVLLLLKRGADVHIGTTALDNTALLWASKKCEHATAKALLDAGADPWRENKLKSTPLTVTKDELMRKLLCAYQEDGGPSWLVRELTARGLDWAEVCYVQKMFAQHGLTSRDALASTPLDAYHLLLSDLTSIGMRQVLLELRLQATWLGARLTAFGMHVKMVEACEVAVMERLGCGTESLFAYLDLQDASVASIPTMTERVRRLLREVQHDIDDAQAAKAGIVSDGATGASAANEEGTWDNCE